MAEKLLDKASYGIIRTNPKLTGNVKIVSNGDNIYLESFSANTQLASSTFKAFKVSGDDTYDRDVFKFFQGGKFPKDLAYEVFQEFQDISVLSQYQNQYEMFYSAGTRSVASEAYSENLGMLSPLWLNEQIPNNFVIFRIDNPAAVNNINESLENNNYLDAQTSTAFTKNVLENCTAIKTFDLSSNSLLGSYIRNYRNQESFPETPLNISWRNDEPLQWAGINYAKGGFTANGSFAYNDLITKDATIIQNESFFTEGFQRNGVLLANLINLEFLFSDADAPDYSINRYFGLYVNEIEEGLFDISGEGFYKNTEKTQLPKIKTITEVSEQLNTPFEMTNTNGMLIYLDPAKTTTITGLPTPQRVNEVESIFYIKDKNNSFHTVKKGSLWGNNEIRIFDTKIDISVLAGFKYPDTYANAQILPQQGKATCKFDILDELTDGFRITFYDGINEVGQIGASSIEVPEPGKSKFQFFNPNGTPEEIAKAITSAINIGIPLESRFFEASYNNGTVFVQSRFAGDRFNRLSFKMDFVDYPLMVNSILTYPLSSVAEDTKNFVGGNDVKGSLLKVTNGDQNRFIKGNWIQSKDGFAQIGDWVPYLDNPIRNKVGKIIGYEGVDENVIITLNDDQINITRSGQVALYSDYRSSFGRFSIFPIKDFDYDFYSTMYSKLGELNFEFMNYNQMSDDGIYTNVSANPEIRSFYDDGGFARLIGLLKDASPDETFDTVIKSEYDRLEENYLIQQATASRIIPYINKWSWVNDGKNVRNLPYSLNVNEAFGQNNFAPSKWEVGQIAQGFTHEWYYLCEFPEYFGNEAIKSSWSYIDYAPSDTIEANPITGAVYTPGTFQKVNKDYFNDYFIIDKFVTGGVINLIDRQLRYGRFSGGDEKNFSEAFLRGVRVIAKSKANPKDKPNFNARSLKYLTDGSFNDYRFSVMLIPNAPDKPTTQIKFVKNEKWKTVVMMIFLTLDNECFNNGEQIIDRTALYSLRNEYVTQSNPNECKPEINPVTNEYIYTKGFLNGAIALNAAQFEPSINAYLIKGIPDINGNATRFLTDIRRGSDGLFNTIKFQIGVDQFEISDIVRVVSNTEFYASTLTKNGVQYFPGGGTPTTSSLVQTSYITIGGGFDAYSTRLTDVGSATLFNNVNLGDPSIIYETIDKDGNRILDSDGNIAQTFAIELRSQEDILKSVYIGALPDPAKPTVFNLTDIIGYGLSLQTKPRITPIGRHAGYYQPTALDILYFRDPYLNVDFSPPIPEDAIYKEKVLELCRYTNTQFNSSDVSNFGQIKNLFYHKVNEEDPSTVLELSIDSAFLSLYPLINEVGIANRNFYAFASNWEPSYFRKSIDKSQVESVIGTRAMTEKKSFFGSKYLKVPEQIELETFEYSPFVKGAINQPSLIEGTFMTSENDTSIKFFNFIQKRLIEFLFNPIKEQFVKYIKPEFSFGNLDTIDDDVIRYITQNILQLYKVGNIDFYVKSTRDDSPIDYSTASLTNAEKSAAGLSINTAVGSRLINNNPFDLSLIYNKRTGFTESFGFSVTIVKK
tara:strand:+ start:6132 stop:10736 length:4605 start_codon:yes stop_codon:yes gene_type:complete